MPTISAIALILALAVFDAAGFSSLGGDRTGGFISEANCAAYKRTCTAENTRVNLGEASSSDGIYACTTFDSHCAADCTCTNTDGSWTCSCPRCTPEDNTYTVCAAKAAACGHRYNHVITTNGYLNKATAELKAQHLDFKMHDARFTGARPQACRDFRGPTQCCDNLASYTPDWVPPPDAIDDDPCDAVADQLTASRTISYLDASNNQCVYGATQTQTRTCTATGKGAEVEYSAYTDYPDYNPCPVSPCNSWGSECCMTKADNDGEWLQHNSVCNALQTACGAQGVGRDECISDFENCAQECKTFMQTCGAYCSFS